MVTCFDITITQNTFVYQDVWVTRYSDWYVIFNVAYVTWCMMIELHSTDMVCLQHLIMLLML